MKRIILSMAVLATTLANAQRGIGTNNPDRSSVLHLESNKRGLLIPNVDIADLSTAAPVSSPATSLLVYNTNSTTGQGFYYWDGSKWVSFISSVTITGNQQTSSVVGTAPVNVTSQTSGNNTEYKVAINGGSSGQVLVANSSGAAEYIRRL